LWTYEQASGSMRSATGAIVGMGYSGAPSARNDPTQEGIVGIGPIPRGLYKLGALLRASEHGPYAIVLVPALTNNMFGRSGFLIHGDNIHDPGDASHGCIIQPYETRTLMWLSGDHNLEVV
jgi:Protein of unknown function (DUF2778)